MFLGTSRIWWIISGVLLVLGFVLMALGQTVFGILALFAAIGSFAAAPMRYGENARLTRKERPGEGGCSTFSRHGSPSRYAGRQSAASASAATA